MTEVSKQDVLNFLRLQSGGVISTLSENQEIDSSFVYFVCNEDLEIYFITNKYTQKFKNIRANKKIAFVVTDEQRQMTVQGKGDGLEVKDEGEKRRIHDLFIQILHGKIESWPPPFEKMQEGDLALIKVKFHHLRYANFGKAPNGSPDHFFTQILP